eukprot:gb/GECG01009827.1/.p1 GENE.gb/GECG01009827.1/~~gb/GECG01009827.1/.p1  ORF type:complete len:635 (+),score=106.24 gb/GECG01009827.1/:1-1905(+)
MNVMGPGETLAAGEAEEYAPDRLPAPMTSEEIVGAISDGYLAPGVNSSIGREYARLKRQEEDSEPVDNDKPRQRDPEDDARGGYVDDTGKWISSTEAHNSLRRAAKEYTRETHRASSRGENDANAPQINRKYLSLSQIVERRLMLADPKKTDYNSHPHAVADGEELDDLTNDGRTNLREKLDEEYRKRHDQSRRVRVDLKESRKRVNATRFAGTGPDEIKEPSKQKVVGQGNTFETAEEMLQRIELEDAGSDSTLEDDLPDGVERPQVPPEYVHTLMSYSQGEGSGLNKFNTVLSDLDRRQMLQEQQNSNLPPGYEAAIKAGNSSSQAGKAAGIYVGNTSVTSSAHDRLLKYQNEVAEFKNTGNRVQALANRMGALSGQMELMQYGALLKPLFKNISRLTQRLGAGPEGPHDKVEAMKAKLEERNANSTARSSDRARSNIQSSSAANSSRPRTKPTLDIPIRKSYAESGRLGQGQLQFTDDSGNYLLEPSVTPRSPTVDEIKARARSKEKQFKEARYVMDETEVAVRRQLGMPNPPKQTVIPPPYTLPDEDELRGVLLEESSQRKPPTQDVLKDAVKQTRRKPSKVSQIDWTLFDEIQNAKEDLAKRLNRPQTIKEKHEAEESRAKIDREEFTA